MRKNKNRKGEEARIETEKGEYGLEEKNNSRGQSEEKRRTENKKVVIKEWEEVEVMERRK